MFFYLHAAIPAFGSPIIAYKCSQFSRNYKYQILFQTNQNQIAN